jgi:glutathione synthase/RimK-type ligase-like ATP-grasp enzyme
MTSSPQRLTVGFAADARHRKLEPDDRLAASEIENLGATVIPVVWSATDSHRTPCDLLIIRSCWDYHLHPEAFLRWIAETSLHSKVLNPPTMLCWNIDKRYLEEFQDMGFPIPRTVVLERGSPADLRSRMALHGFESVIVKPAISASSYGTFLVPHGKASAFNARVGRLLQERVMLLQEFIPEVHARGEWSLIFLGESFSHALWKLPREGDFRAQSEFGGSVKAMPPPAEALHLATKLVEKFAGNSLYCRVDLLESDRGWLVLELELIDPELFFGAAPDSARRFAALALAAAKAALRNPPGRQSIPED